MSDSPNNKLPYVPQDTLDPAAGLNDAIRVIDALLNTRVENMTQNSPTSADQIDGRCFIVGNAPTAEWSGHAHALAQYAANGSFWNFYEAGVTAWLVLNKADGNLYKWNPSTPAWEIAAGIGEAPTDGNLYGRKDSTWVQMPDVTHAVISVNGQTPDTSGNVSIQLPSAGIQAVNGIGPDSNGDAIIPTARLNGINDQTGVSYTVSAADEGKDIRCTNAGAVTLLIDSDAATSIPVGFCCIFSQGGAGAVTAVAAHTNVLLRAPNGAATTAQYDARVLEYLGSDEWRIW